MERPGFYMNGMSMGGTFAAIRGIGRMTVGEMRAEIRQGARFVTFEYVLSFVITRRKISPIFFVRPGERTFFKGLPYNLLTLLTGWWSFPFGPANTIGAVKDNLQGGRDVTHQVIEQILDAADRQIKSKRRR
ncbi:MAG TPA: hypothetical protein VLG46_03225 [Anaerolineae bacterium]|nr:hypothetical protein [Anaerolineae bacterium]